jgi:hypothetical protein
MFAPGTSIGGQRALKLARRIGEYGWEPFVLTAPAGCQRPIDPEYGKDVLEKVDVTTVPCFSLMMHTRYHAEETRWWRQGVLKAGRGLHCCVRRFVPETVFYPWVFLSERFGAALVRRVGIDLVWATTPHISASLIAQRIRERTGVPYVVDYRDVSLYGGSATNRELLRRLESERGVLREATGISYVAPPQYKMLREIEPGVESKPTCLAYNWFEKEEWDDVIATPSEELILFHGGSLYGGTRRLDGFLAALAILNQKEGKCKKFVFRQHGMKSSKHLVDQANGLGIGHRLQLGENLNRESYLTACRSASILLLVVGHDFGRYHHSGAIPGKLYDYLAAQRPILVVGPEGCEAGRMVSDLKRGLAVADDDPSAIAAAIERLANEREDIRIWDPSPEAVSEFEAQSVVSQISEFLHSVVSA